MAESYPEIDVEESEDYIHEMNRIINVYEAALRGEIEVHYWSSPISRIMDTAFRLPGTPPEDVSSNMPYDHMIRTKTQYAGVMGKELLRERIDSLSIGLGRL